MIKNKIIPLFAVLLSLVSCNDTPSQDYYDYNWTKGETAIEINQPTVKNPQAQLSNLNKMRQTQNKLGLSSLGQSNILVVPVEFKGDDELKDSYKKLGYDIDLNIFDVKHIDDAYFGTPKEYVSVKEYYKQSSFDKCKIDGVTSPVVTLPESFITYLLKANNVGVLEVLNEIVDYIYNYIFVETKSLYVGDFDSNDDQKVDAISIVLNYDYTFKFDDKSGYAALNGIVPYFTNISNTIFENSFAQSAYSPKINSYSVISNQFHVKNSSRAFINNVGLMLGLDHYADLTGNMNTGYQRACLGFVDMMDGLIGDHNPFSKYQLGWTKPKTYNASMLENELEVEIDLSTADNSSIVLHTDEHNEFGEYLMLDLYTPTGLNEANVTEKGIYGTYNFSESGIRVYKVDSRLVRGVNGNFINYYGKTDFNDEITLSNGSTTKYEYDYAYTNSGINDYYSSGITANFPLVSFLSKNGINRHLVHYSFELTNDDLFQVGDTFGETGVPGFYKSFRFNGETGNNGDYLDISFEVKSIEGQKATLVLKGGK